MATIDDIVFFEDRKILKPVLDNYDSNIDILNYISGSEVNADSIEYLSLISSDIELILETTKKYDGKNLEKINISLPYMISKTKSLDNSFFSAMEYVLVQLEEGFIHDETELKKISQTGLIKDLNSFRSSLDGLAGKYLLLSENVLKKPMFKRYSLPVFEDYLAGMKKRKELTERLDFIEEKYVSTHWDKSSKNILDRFVREKTFLGIKKEPIGGFSLNDIIEGYKEIGYFEGVFEAQELKKDIINTIDNFTDILDYKNSLEEDIKEGRRLFGFLEKMFDKINVPAYDDETLSALNFIYSNHTQKESITYRSSRLLSSLVKEKNDMSEKLTIQIHDFLKTKSEEFDKSYSNISSSLPLNEGTFKFLDKYERFIQFTSEVLGLSDMLPGITDTRERLLHKKVDSGLRQIEEVVCTEPVNYADMVSHIRHLSNARVALETLKPHVPPSFTGRMDSLEAMLEDNIVSGKKTKELHDTYESYQAEIKVTSSKLEATRKRLTRNISMEEVEDFMQACTDAVSYKKLSTSDNYLKDMVDDINKSVSLLKLSMKDTYDMVDSGLQKMFASTYERDKSEIYKIYGRLSEIFEVGSIFDAKSPENDMIMTAVRQGLDELKVEILQSRDNHGSQRYQGNREIRIGSMILPTGAYNKENGSFLIPMYLSAIGINPYYFWFKEIVTSPDKGWDDKLYEIGTRFLEGNAKNIKDYDYVQHLFYSISESINRGELTEKHSKDTMFRQVADQTLSNMAGYLSRSQEYLGMSPKDIDDHRPVESLKNHYNNSLCSRI